MSEDDIGPDSPPTQPPVAGAGESSAEVVALQKEEIERLRCALDGVGAGDTEKKYLDALRKVKATNVKLESERAKVAKLTKQVIDCDARLREAERAASAPTGGVALTRHTSDAASDLSPTHQKALIRELKNKLADAQKANAELKRHQAASRQETAKMRDLLRREVGEQHDLQALVDTPASEGWRGRAQTITLLRQRVKDLQKQLQDTQGHDRADDRRPLGPDDSASQTCKGAASQHGGYMGEAATGVTSNRDFDDVNRAKLSEVTSARRAREGDQKRLIATLQKTAADAKDKHTAALARITVFEKENTSLKMQLSRVIQKTENDDKLVGAYKTELEALRAEYRKALQTHVTGSTPSHAPQDMPQTTSPLGAPSQDSVGCLQAFDREKSRRIRALDEQIYTTFARSGDAIVALLADAAAQPQPSLAPLHAAELRHMQEYCTFLRTELDEERCRCEQLEDALNREMYKAPAGAQPFDPNALPPQVVSHVSILKGEVGSLKERIDLLRQNHEAELSILRSLIEEQKESAENVAESFEVRRGEFEAEREQLSQDHSNLKECYRELKVELNRLMEPNASPAP